MKQAIRDAYGGIDVSLTGRGSMVPNEHCYCEIDPDARTSGAFRCCASTGNGATTS